METKLPRQVNTVIVGNGPSALILSYILHGHIPVYDQSTPHPDTLLHEKLKTDGRLLDVNVDYVTEHFAASRFSYSTQALPINVLLDTLLRPLAETDDREHKTCIKWRYDASRRVPHLVVGNAVQTGGQWVSDPAKASWDIGTLSYASMLSLPGYDFAQFYLDKYNRPLDFLSRPSRREVAEYFAIYPHRVGIADAIWYGETLSGIQRAGSGFYIASHQIICDHLVLASGAFTSPVQPEPHLRPLLSLPNLSESTDPMLVIGSGFSAADVILSAKPNQKIIHLFKWSPARKPSPLKACHQHAYPEYAGVYRKMKAASLASKQSKHGRPAARRAPSSAFDCSRDWSNTYEGLPNAQVIDVTMDHNSAIVTFKNDSDLCFQRRISSFAYVVGRRGTLDYLEPKLRSEICPQYNSHQGLSGLDLREKANDDLQVAENVFIIGSLTGDTLIRFAYGGCVWTAGKIMDNIRLRNSPQQSPRFKSKFRDAVEKTSSSFVPSMSGLDGHAPDLGGLNREILPLDRRKAMWYNDGRNESRI